jgi:hypothetical protein
VNFMAWTKSDIWRPKTRASKASAHSVLMSALDLSRIGVGYQFVSARGVSEHACVGIRTGERALLYWVRMGLLKHSPYLGYCIVPGTHWTDVLLTGYTKPPIL